jgi:hypothetical protein
MRKNLGTYLLLPFLLIFVILFLFFIGFKIWIAHQFNKDGNLLLVTYPDPSKLYEITRSKIVVWEYDLSKEKSHREIAEAIYATRLKNGNTLIVDPEVNSVYEVDRSKKVIWRCDSLTDDDTMASRLSRPLGAQRLPNGNTLIIDTRNSRVIEVTKDCSIKWKYICSQNDSSIVPISAFEFSDDLLGIILSGHSRFEYVEVELDSNRVVKRIDLKKYRTPKEVILSNRHIMLALLSEAIELDTLGNIVWRFEPTFNMFKTLPKRSGRFKRPLVLDVYPTYGKNIYIYTDYGILKVTPSRDVIWKLSADEGIRDVFGIKFFQKGLGNPYARLYHLAGVIEH